MDMDAHSQRLTLLAPNGPIGTERANIRPTVDLAPLPYDKQFDPVPLSEFPVRPSRMPIAIQSMGQYAEWSDGNNALKREFIQLYSGGALSSPSPTPEQYGDWMSYDEYRLSFIGARGSYADA